MQPRLASEARAGLAPLLESKLSHFAFPETTDKANAFDISQRSGLAPHDLLTSR
jgi:hypothetical protein